MLTTQARDWVERYADYNAFFRHASPPAPPSLGIERIDAERFSDGSVLVTAVLEDGQLVTTVREPRQPHHSDVGVTCATCGGHVSEAAIRALVLHFDNPST